MIQWGWSVTCCCLSHFELHKINVDSFSCDVVRLGGGGDLSSGLSQPGGKAVYQSGREGSDAPVPSS